MFKRVLFALILTAGPAYAQAPPTPPARGGTGSVTVPTAGQIMVGTSGGIYAPATASGNCTIAAGGVITCAAFSAVLTGTTGIIGGGALLAGACTSGTVAVANSTTAMVATASPVTYPGDGFGWGAYVSANGTVTVKVCGSVAGTPTASTYNVRVAQ